MHVIPHLVMIIVKMNLPSQFLCSVLVIIVSVKFPVFNSILSSPTERTFTLNFTVIAELQLIGLMTTMIRLRLLRFQEAETLI